MKKKWLLIFFLCLSKLVFASFPCSLPADSTDDNFDRKQSITNHILPEKAEQPAGKRLSFAQKLVLKQLYRQLKREEEKHKTNWLTIVGGFLLGFWLPLIGLGIAYVVTKNKDFRKWALIGLITYITVGLFVLFLILTGVIPVF